MCYCKITPAAKLNEHFYKWGFMWGLGVVEDGGFDFVCPGKVFLIILCILYYIIICDTLRVTTELNDVQSTLVFSGLCVKQTSVGSGKIFCSRQNMPLF